MNITTIRAKFSRKLQRPGYETNYEPQYAEFEATGEFAEGEAAEQEDMNELCDVVKAQVAYLLGEEGEGKLETSSETLAVSRDTQEAESAGVDIHAATPAPATLGRRRGANPSQAKSSAGDASNADSGGQATKEAAPQETSAATTASLSRRRGSAPANHTAAGTAQPQNTAAPTAAKIIKDMDLSKAASELARVKGPPAVIKLLSLFGVPDVSKLKDGQRQEFLDLAKKEAA